MIEQNPQQPNNRRIFAKNKSVKEMTKNQRTSTNDSEEDTAQIKSIIKKNSMPSISNLGVPINIQKIITKNKTESLQTLPRKKKQKNCIYIKYDLRELKNNINDMNSKINEEKNTSINIYNSLNKEIIDKNIKIKALAEEQQELINKLKIIKNEINEKIDKAHILISKKNEENKKEKILQNLINEKEKEIELANKNTENEKKEYQRILKIYKLNDSNKENNLRKELFLLDNEISKLQHDNRKLQTILDQHKYCNKHKSELLNYLSVLTNAYQFEVKKASMIDITINSESEPDLNNLKLETINNNNLNGTKSINVFRSPKIKSTKFLFNKGNNNNKQLLISKSTSNYIINIFNNINSEYRKETGIIKNSNNINFKTKKKNLFSSKENLFLEKIIPNNYLIKCKERFDNIEKENTLLKEKINLNKIKSNEIKNEKQMKIGIKRVNINASQKEKMKLNIDIYKSKKTLDELKREMNDIKKEMKKYKKITYVKKKENLNIKQKMNEFKKRSKRGNKKAKENKGEGEENMNNNEESELSIQRKKSQELKEENQKNNIIYNPKSKHKRIINQK